MVGQFVAVFILGWLGGAAGVAFGAYLALRPYKSNQPTVAQKTASRFPFSWKKEPQPEAPRVPLGTIPRTRGSWRRQRLELQKAHNTKQKERDALMEKANATQTR